jgi:acetylglutamate kinase
VDGGLLRVERMAHPSGDLGWVGQIVDANPAPVLALLDARIVPVISPISLGLDGHSYNVNADHAAMAIARALRAERLAFVSNVPGVLVAGQCVRAVTPEQAEAWIAEGIVTGGMIPKVRSALEAVASGVPLAVIADLAGLIAGSGTAFVRQRST